MEAKRWTLGVVLAAAVSLFGLIQADASPFSTYILTDDLGNLVNGTAPEQSEWGTDGDGSDSSDGTSGSDTTTGDGNNGHGNNEDGVDSSNEGNSKEGEDTLCADGTYCDDESKSTTTTDSTDSTKTNNGGKKK